MRRRAGQLILGALIVALAGCGGAASEDAAVKQAQPTALTASIKPLALHLDVGSYVTTSSRATIRGTATRSASVEVDRAFVKLHAGRWQRVVALHLGANRVIAEASMHGHAPLIRSITITRHRSAAELEARAQAKQEAEVRASEKREAEARTREAEAGVGESEASSCTNGTYVNSAGNTVCKPEQSPTVPAGATARCEDGTYSFSESRSGTCSHHGGVAEWLTG